MRRIAGVLLFVSLISCSATRSLESDVGAARAVLYHPQHTPRQAMHWECGYFSLLFLKIVAEKTGVTARAITEYDTETVYRDQIAGMAAGTAAPFMRHLRTLLDRSVFG